MGRVLLALTLTACGLLAQAPSTARLVRLSAEAVDANGQPVTDLTADDFKIADQNKAETVFAFFKPGHGQGAPADALTFSNRNSAATPHTSVILLDLINLADSDRQENWKALDKAIPQLRTNNLG